VTPVFCSNDRINKDNPFFPKHPIRATNPCITGDTLIAVADGRNAVTIKELADDGKDVPVYSRSADGQVQIRYGRNPRLTGKNMEIFKVTFDDDSSIRLTGNHKVMLRNGEYRAVSDLAIGDSIAPFNSFNNNGYRRISESGDKMRTGYHINKRQYNLIYEFYHDNIPDGMCMHHIDYDKKNDRPDNLVLMDACNHAELHAKDMVGENNPYHRMTPEWKHDFASHPGDANSKYIDISNDELIDIGKEILEMNGDLTKRMWIDEAKRRNIPQNLWTDFRFGSWSSFKNNVVANHKVTSIENAGFENVYNITVDDNHNYCIITRYEDDSCINSSGITVKNCGEVPLLPYESCCLGSINLANCVTKDGDLDKGKLDEITESGTYFLMGMNKSSQFPIPECYSAQERYFRLGLGVMGYADMLMKMNVFYDSGEALKIIDKIGRILQKSHKYAPLSVATLSIAPTGSLSIIADCSSGIEPIFADSYTRNVVAGTFHEKRKHEYLRTTHEITPEWHVKVLARWQKWIDNGVSKTINLSHDASVSDVVNVYKLAWKSGCKGGNRVQRRVAEETTRYTRHRQRGECEGESCHL